MEEVQDDRREGTRAGYHDEEVEERDQEEEPPEALPEQSASDGGVPTGLGPDQQRPPEFTVERRRRAWRWRTASAALASPAILCGAGWVGIVVVVVGIIGL